MLFVFFDVLTRMSHHRCLHITLMELNDIVVLVPSTRLVASPYHLGNCSIFSFRVIRVPHIEECKNLLPAQIVNVYTAIL